jgi:hypothetical protein
MAIDAILFTGIAGLKKRERLAHLRNFVLNKYETLGPEHSAGDQAADIIPIVELVHLTRAEIDGDFFDLYRTYDERLKKFSEEIAKLRKNKQPPRCIFIHTHLTHFMTGHIRSWLGCANRQLFDGLNIRKIINLIDNVYSCQREVQNDGYSFSLSQFTTWRDIEQMVTEAIATILFPGQSQFETSKVIAINHCLHTVADAIFSETKPQIYMAYPISKIRDIALLAHKFGNITIEELDENAVKNFIGDERESYYLKLLKESLQKELSQQTLGNVIEYLQGQILHFRQSFSSRFVAYDPSTIDEVPLIAEVATLPEAGKVSIDPRDRWPLTCEPQHRLAGRDVFSSADDRIEILASQIRELLIPGTQAAKKTSIERQIRSRDFRLIEQSQGLVAYRPTMGGRWSGSVLKEIEHVRRLKRPFFVIKDATYDGPLDEGSALGWEYGDQHWGKWDLSNANNRTEAFKIASERLSEQIRDSARQHSS